MKMPGSDSRDSAPRAWRRHFFRHPRPPWWPENEEWPPVRRWRGGRNPFFRRLGCLFMAFNLFGFVIFLAIAVFVLNALGLIRLTADQFHWFYPVAGVFAGLMVALMAMAGLNLRRMSIPLDNLLDASNKVAEGDYSARVDEKGPPEVRLMARAFNSMASRLQVNDQQRRAMLADVSHELRTPITVMQGNLEGMLDGVYSADAERLKSLYEETQVLSRLVDDLRTLALAESGSLQLKREPTDLRPLIREIVSGFDSQAGARGIKVELSLGNVQELELDPLRIREVLSNLLANALRYSPPEATVRIALADSGTGPEGGALISIEDRGPGLPAADLGRVFDRFYKSSDSGGMGLGLSIAKYLVEAHGGRIWAESPAGGGTRISFTLPG
jgi:signal transduction histidine kinase